MTTPEEAVERARASLESMRAGGGLRPGGEPGRGHDDHAVVAGKLFEWALIEPDVAWVRSTRRYGRADYRAQARAAVAAAQYHAELLAEQTRFNVNVLETSAGSSEDEARGARAERGREREPGPSEASASCSRRSGARHDARSRPGAS